MNTEGYKKYRKISAKPGPMEYPLPAVMVSCGSLEEANIITIAWTGIVNSNPPMTYISVQPSRHSHDIIEESGEFAINLVNKELAMAMDYCGVKSGRNVDKFKELNLTAVASDVVKAPSIAESPVSIECKLMEKKSYGSHDMYVAEIVAIRIAEEFVDSDGAYRFDRMRLVAFNHGSYYELKQEELGFFGYSVMKPKTAKKKRKYKNTKKNK